MWEEHIRLSEAGSDLQRLIPGGVRAGLIYLREVPFPHTTDEPMLSTPRENRDPARYQVEQHPYGGCKSVVNDVALVKASVITDEAAHLAY